MTLACSAGVPAGLEDGYIKDAEMSASSVYGDGVRLAPWYARLHNESFWAVALPAGNEDHWLQIDLLFDTRPIKGIRTQGSLPGIGQWVWTLQVHTGNDETSLEPIMEFGVVKVSLYRRGFFPATQTLSAKCDVTLNIKMYLNYTLKN